MLRILGTEYNPAHQAFEVYVAGCTRNCQGCHNPESHAFGKGRRWPEWLRDNRFKLGTRAFKHVWVLGGDLLCQPEPVDALEFIKALRRAMPESMQLWLWTGASLEDVPPEFLGWPDYVKTGIYQREKAGILMEYEEDAPLLLLASDNQQLWRKREERYEPCRRHHKADAETGRCRHRQGTR